MRSSKMASLKSEIRVLYINDFNETVIKRFFKAKELEFTELSLYSKVSYLHQQDPSVIDRNL